MSFATGLRMARRRRHVGRAERILAIVVAFVVAFIVGMIAGYPLYGLFLSVSGADSLNRIDPSVENGAGIIGLASAIGAALWAWKWGRDRAGPPDPLLPRRG